MFFQKLALWENIKASLAGAVPYGVCYHKYKTFNPQDVHHRVGI